MAEENKNFEVNEVSEQNLPKDAAAKAQKKTKANKKPNFFVRGWRALKKFLSDTRGELKKVVWTPKNELIKNSKLVIVTVIAVGIAIAIVDLTSSFIINTIAGWISIG